MSEKIKDLRLLAFYDDQATILNMSRDAISFVDRALCVDVSNELEPTDASAVLYIVSEYLGQACEQLERFAKNKVEIMVK